MKTSEGCLLTTQFAETHFLKELLLNFTTTYPDMTYCGHMTLAVTVLG